MLNKIIRFFRPEPTVASITSAFTKQVIALDELSAAKNKEVIQCDDQIAALRVQSNAAVEEAQKARAIAARIDALIEG
jgi:hypothetical protein